MELTDADMATIDRIVDDNGGQPSAFTDLYLAGLRAGIERAAMVVENTHFGSADESDIAADIRALLT